MQSEQLNPEALADRLREARGVMQLYYDLTQNWDAFCDADPLPYPAGDDTDAEFPQRLEAGGYVELVPADREALEDPFAAERGIEPGGQMWRLTDHGKQARTAIARKDSPRG